MTIVSGLRIIDSNAQTGITWWNWTAKCFESLPENWMSDIDKKFTTKLLQANQKQLKKLCIKN